MLAIGIGVMEAGRLADAVIAKRPKIAKAAQDIVRQRVMRRLSDKPRAKSRRQKLPAILDTLTLATGAGFINERSFLDAWDKKYPLPKLSAADRQRLRQMAAAINLLPEGILRQAEAIKFQNEVALIEGIKAVDALTAAWYANLLAGISTQGVNVWGNGLNLFFRSLAVGLASPADVTKLFSGLAAGVRPGLREAKEVIKTGQLLKVNKMDDMQVSGTLELMAQQGRPIGFGQWLAIDVESIAGADLVQVHDLPRAAELLLRLLKARLRRLHALHHSLLSGALLALLLAFADHLTHACCQGLRRGLWDEAQVVGLLGALIHVRRAFLHDPAAEGRVKLACFPPVILRAVALGAASGSADGVLVQVIQ